MNPALILKPRKKRKCLYFVIVAVWSPDRTFTKAVCVDGA